MKKKIFHLLLLFALLATCGGEPLQAQTEVRATLRGGEEIEGVLTGADADSISLIVMREVEKPFPHKVALPVRYALPLVESVQPGSSPSFLGSMFLGLLVGSVTYALILQSFSSLDVIEAVPIHFATTAAATALLYLAQPNVDASERYHPVLAEDLAALQKLSTLKGDNGEGTEPQSVWKRAQKSDCVLAFELTDGERFKGVLYDVRPDALTVLSDEDTFRAHFDGRTCCAVPLTTLRSICPVFDEDAWEWRPGSGDPAFLAQFAVAEIKTR